MDIDHARTYRQHREDVTNKLECAKQEAPGFDKPKWGGGNGNYPCSKYKCPQKGYRTEPEIARTHI